MRIFVNGAERDLEPENLIIPGKMSYLDAVRLATGRRDKDAGAVVYTVTYWDPILRRGGSLIPGEGVDVVPGMVVNAVVTDAA